MVRPRNPESEERILDAAVRLLREGGPDFSLVEVARRSGVSRGAIYRRFPTVHDLLQSLVRERGVEPEEVSRTGTRTRILDAFDELVRTEDLWSISLDRVAQVAGVGVATVYRHFKDREGLLEAFAAERTPRSFAPELALAGSDLYGDLHRLTMAALRFLLDHPALLRSIGAPQTADRRMRPDSRSLRTVLQSYLRKQIEAGRVRGDPRVITHSLLGLTFGAIMFDRDATETNPDESAAAIVDILLHGCATRRTRRRK